MDALLDALMLSNPNVRYVVLGCVLLGCAAAVVGTFTVLRKRSLVGDAVAHSVLPGVCGAFLVAHTKHPIALLVGAFLSGWLSLVVIDGITRKTRIKEDAAIGIVLSVFFGIGILMLTAIQQTGSAAQSGLDKFLFGKAASLLIDDVVVFGGIAALLIAVVVLFFKEFFLLSFDRDFARIIGLRVPLLELLLSTMTVLAVVAGIQAVGVVLMAALLITPAAAARYWTEKLSTMVAIAGLFGMIAGVTGAYISTAAPSMPTGPWIVVVISMLFVGSALFAPQRGVVARALRYSRNRKKMTDENILKALYQMSETAGNTVAVYRADDIRQRRAIQPMALQQGLARLRRQGYVSKQSNGWALTDEGVERGRRVARLHRLWEVYLSRHLHLAPDHVHDSAESIEHILTPELERQLALELDYPDVDPHNSPIPYKGTDKPDTHNRRARQ